MNKKPVIGISGNLLIDPSGQFENYMKAYVNEDYVTAVLKAGGVPVILPIVDDEEVIRAQVAQIDGIIFSGGHDVNPKLYGEEKQEKCMESVDRRDWFDLHALKIAKELCKPILCICRGHQLSAVAHGGTLYQDVSYAKGITLKHELRSNPDYPAHLIDVDPKSQLYGILGKEKVWVNSFHHQLIKDIPEGFNVSALAPDGCIEALEPEFSEHFYLTLQWHPEMMAARGNEDMLKVFHRLIEEASK